MGGDDAPNAIVAGVHEAVTIDQARIILVGHRARVAAALSRFGDRLLGDRLRIEHAEDHVPMDASAAVIRTKRDASVRIAARLVRDRRARAMVTAGHTGAALIAAKVHIGTVAGVDRPALAGVFPSRCGGTVVLDVGANLTAKPAQLFEFAVMGHFYAQTALGLDAPRVGLMSVGEEAGKGDESTRAAFDILENTGLNFVGNVEGRSVFDGSVDVIVCNGFVGNVLLKSCESLAYYTMDLLREAFTSTARSKIGAGLLTPSLRRLRKRLDWSEQGAAPLLGIRGGCFIGHGSSDAKAIKNAVRRAVEFCNADLDTKIEDRVAELHRQEAALLGA